MGEHQRQMLEAATFPRRPGPKAPQNKPLHMVTATPGPDVTVYGYLAYWDDDLDTVPWDQLSHIALFCADVDSSGNVTGTSRWGDIAAIKERADAYGVRVHLTVINFSTSSISAFLNSATARQKLIDALQAKVTQYDLAGVNIDFENLAYASKTQMVDFADQLDDHFEEVVLATPAVDWNGAWDYSELTKHADLFIMGYGYHYSGSTRAGPTDPLFGGGPWGRHSLAWTVDDYLSSDADLSRVILGLPLYGYSWATPSDTVGTTATSSGSTLFYTDGASRMAEHGRRFDEVSRSPWAYGNGRQSWVPDAPSVIERVEYAVDRDLAGVGIWALNYDVSDAPDAELWTGIGEATTFVADDPVGDTDVPVPEDTDTPASSDTDSDSVPPEDTDAAPAEGNADGNQLFSANAGQPFYAYVGDVVELQSDGSSGPGGVNLEYRWTQVSGPPVPFESDSERPSFNVREPGNLVFTLEVGDGETWSAPASSYVVVIDRSVGNFWGGCQTVPAGSSALLAGVALLARRQRRAAHARDRRDVERISR